MFLSFAFPSMFPRLMHRRKSIDSVIRKAREMTKPHIPEGLHGPWLAPDDAGFGSIRPEQTVGLAPDDAGLGNIRPEQVVGLGPDDAGLGNICPEQVVGLGPDDAGLGSIRPEQTVGLARGPQGFMSWLVAHWFGRTVQ